MLLLNVKWLESQSHFNSGILHVNREIEYALQDPAERGRVTGEAEENELFQELRKEKGTCRGQVLPQMGIQIAEKWAPRALLFKQIQQQI